MKHPILLLVCTCSILSACHSSEVGQPSNTNAVEDGILVSLKASVDNEGNCRPEKKTTLHSEQNPKAELYMLHGEQRYAQADGYVFTTIPLQEKMGSSSTVLMNKTLPCDQIVVEIEVSHCVYYDQNRQEMQCPNIQVSGEDQFKTFKLVRNDTTLTLP